MAKVGDTIRFLNSTGGGVIRKIDGKIALVEDEDGFESPYLIKDLVVVLPAGHESSVKGSKLMFDQKAFDAGKENTEADKKMSVKMNENTEEEDETPPEETAYGDAPTILLAFEPDNIKKLSDTKFAAVLVNDSNYYLDFTFLRKSSDERGWNLVYSSTLSPNELMDLAVITHEDLPDYQKIVLQGVAYKKDSAFSLLPPINVTRRLDLTKFHKLHCFRQSKYFDGEVLEFPLVNSGLEIKQETVEPEALKKALNGDITDKGLRKELDKKYNEDKGKRKIKTINPADNPYKKLPLIEVDLHIGELIDSTSGMEPKDMLELQLSEVRKTMSAHSKRVGQKIVFIHGKGEGVLRKAVLELLKKEYPKATLQDASFREYGFGATLVTV